MKKQLLAFATIALSYVGSATWATAATINLSTGTATYSIVNDTNPNPPDGTTVNIVTGLGADWITSLSDGIGQSGQWIAPNADQTGISSTGVTGYTEYEVQFDLTGLNLSTAVLTMNLAGDDAVDFVDLNPSSPPTDTAVDNTIFQPTASELSNGMWTASSGTFTYSGSDFQSGLNTLYFFVDNFPGDGTYSTGGPTGLDVAASVTATPEPSTALPLALAFAVGFFLLRKRAIRGVSQ